jgi:protocatechuate 3,4-dioxygenase alpha subunit
MTMKTVQLPQTASQTAGPYVHIGLAPGEAGFDTYERELGRLIAPAHVPGDRVRIEGKIIDGDENLVLDALLETWQADSKGAFPGHGASDGFLGWGRASTHFETGLWHIDTIKPGPVPGPDGTHQAPHILVWIVARGINIGLWTRVYFDDEGEKNSNDPILTSIPDEARRKTLIAKMVGEEDGCSIFRFDMYLLGDNETVFFET